MMQIDNDIVVFLIFVGIKFCGYNENCGFNKYVILQIMMILL